MRWHRRQPWSSSSGHCRASARHSFPVSVSVLTNAFAAARASHAIGLAYGIAGLGNAAGPLIGGLLTETVGWRWIFWLNVPLTLVTLAIGAWSIRESFDETVPRRIDVTGLALVVVGVGLFTLTFDRGPTGGGCRHGRWRHSPAHSPHSRYSSSSRTGCAGRWWTCRSRGTPDSRCC